jgi:hypothetical protein
MPLHTHYDNLKVTRKAPPEVVRAAYRVLAQRYHPDVNPSPDAARIMKAINVAYAVLSDPQRRAEHDAWIKDQLIQEAIDEAMAGVRQSSDHRDRSSHPPGRHAAETMTQPLQSTALVRFNNWMATPAGTKFGLAVIASGALVAWLWVTTPANRTSPSSQTTPYTAPVVVTAPKPPEIPPPESEVAAKQTAPKGGTYREFHGALDHESPSPQRTTVKAATFALSPATPAWSPNGKSWPDRAAYLDGFARRASSGLTTIKIDNANGGADVYVKLCQSSTGKCDGLRHVFIPQGASFTMRNITPGWYDIRYRSLDNGALAKSQPMQLRQIDEENRTRYSNVTLTLYRIKGGNTSFEGLSEEKF